MRRSSRNGFFGRLVSRAGLLLGVVRGVPEGLLESQEGHYEPIDPTTRAEAGDVWFRAVLLTGAIFLLTLWAIVLLIYPFFSYLRHERAEGEPAPLAAARHGLPVPPEPRLQADPRRDLQDMRKYEEGQLNHYNWVDRAHGVVSIPIDRAIGIIVQRGIPPQPAPPGMTYYDPHVGTRETGFEGKVEPEPR